MVMFDMTPREAAHAFDIPVADLLEMVVSDAAIGFWSLGGRVMGITSLDLEAALGRVREREALAQEAGA